MSDPIKGRRTAPRPAQSLAEVLTDDDYLGADTRNPAKVYLTVAQIKAFGVIENATAVQIESAVAVLSLMPSSRLEDGTPKFDPVPIREYLTSI